MTRLSFHSSWQPVRFVWTKTSAAFGKIMGEDCRLMDAIPLEEIDHVHAMQDAKIKDPPPDAAPGAAPKRPSLLKTASIHISRAIRSDSDAAADRPANPKLPALPPSTVLIATVEKGYNSGRKYYLQAASEAQRREVVDALDGRVRAARKAREAKGRLRRLQVAC
jgi:hypothetical protein